jgi:hypothetical protein
LEPFSGILKFGRQAQVGEISGEGDMIGPVVFKVIEQR